MSPRRRPAIATTTSAPEQLLSPQDVSVLLRLDEKTVRKMAARGDFPGAIRMGNSPQSHIRIPAAGVAHWQNSQTPADA